MNVSEQRLRKIRRQMFAKLGTEWDQATLDEFGVEPREGDR